MHPKNPFAPTVHFNYRYFETDSPPGTDLVQIVHLSVCHILEPRWSQVVDCVKMVAIQNILGAALGPQQLQSPEG
jgi:coproporphyrinogen III oxidase